MIRSQGPFGEVDAPGGRPGRRAVVDRQRGHGREYGQQDRGWGNRTIGPCGLFPPSASRQAPRFGTATQCRPRTPKSGPGEASRRPPERFATPAPSSWVDRGHSAAAMPREPDGSRSRRASPRRRPGRVRRAGAPDERHAVRDRPPDPARPRARRGRPAERPRDHLAQAAPPPRGGPLRGVGLPDPRQHLLRGSSA